MKQMRHPGSSQQTQGGCTTQGGGCSPPLAHLQAQRLCEECLKHLGAALHLNLFGSDDLPIVKGAVHVCAAAWTTGVAGALVSLGTGATPSPACAFN